MRITITCPHCRARAVANDSRELSVTLREITYSCTNYLCGHTYVCALEVVRTLSPSAIPAADVQLPISKHVRREQLAFQLAHADEAEAETDFLANVHRPMNDWTPARPPA